MKIAIMQPYFIPYIGYFELINEVDIFVFLNDVQFIRRGWINRNKIRSKDKDFQYLTIPTFKAKQQENIKNIKMIKGWSGSVLRTINHTFKDKNQTINDMICEMDNQELISEALMYSIKKLSRYLGIKCLFKSSTGISSNKRENKIIDI